MIEVFSFLPISDREIVLLVLCIFGGDCGGGRGEV
jgi:hypothetical protein